MRQSVLPYDLPIVGTELAVTYQCWPEDMFMRIVTPFSDRDDEFMSYLYARVVSGTMALCFIIFSL